MLIVNPNTDEDRQKEIVDRLRTTVEKDKGAVAGVDEWGKKKLAYEIKKESEGIYTVITFTATPQTLSETERVLSITDEVLRFGTKRMKSSSQQLAGADWWLADALRQGLCAHTILDRQHGQFELIAHRLVRGLRRVRGRSAGLFGESQVRIARVIGVHHQKVVG